MRVTGPSNTRCRGCRFCGMGTGAVSKVMRRSLSWSGDVEDFRSLVSTVGSQVETLLGPAPVDPGPNASVSEQYDYQHDMEQRAIQVSISEPKFDTTISGSIDDVVTDPDIDLTRASEARIWVGRTHDSTLPSIDIRFRRRGFDPGVTLEVTGKKSNVVAANAVVYDKVRDRRPWWAFMCSDFLAAAVVLSLTGTWLVVALLVGDRDESSDDAITGTFLGVAFALGVTGFLLVWGACRLLQLYVFPGFEMSTGQRVPRARRFRTVFVPIVASVALGTGVTAILLN